MHTLPRWVLAGRLSLFLSLRHFHFGKSRRLQNQLRWSIAKRVVVISTARPTEGLPTTAASSRRSADYFLLASSQPAKIPPVVIESTAAALYLPRSLLYLLLLLILCAAINRAVLQRRSGVIYNRSRCIVGPLGKLRGKQLPRYGP